MPPHVKLRRVRRHNPQAVVSFAFYKVTNLLNRSPECRPKKSLKICNWAFRVIYSVLVDQAHKFRHPPFNS